MSNLSNDFFEMSLTAEPAEPVSTKVLKINF